MPIKTTNDPVAATPVTDPAAPEDTRTLRGLLHLLLDPGPLSDTSLPAPVLGRFDASRDVAGRTERLGARCREPNARSAVREYPLRRAPMALVFPFVDPGAVYALCRRDEMGGGADWHRNLSCSGHPVAIYAYAKSSGTAQLLPHLRIHSYQPHLRADAAADLRLCLAAFSEAARHYRQSRPLPGALTNTDLTGIMFSAALLLEYAAYFWTRRLPINIRRPPIGMAAYLVLFCFSVHTLTLAKDISWATTGHLFAHAGSFAHSCSLTPTVTVAAWWPFADGYPHQFWNTDSEIHRSAVLWIPFALAALYWTFRKQRNLLLLMGLLCTACALLCSFRLYRIRAPLGHHRRWVPRRRLDSVRREACQKDAAIGWLPSARDWRPEGCSAVAASWTHPFSETGNVAAWMRAHHYDKEPLVGASDYNLAGVAEQLQRPAFFLTVIVSTRT